MCQYARNGYTHNHEATNADAVTTAIDYFNFHARELLTRATDQEPTSEAPYLVGNLIPDWDSSVTVANEQKSYTDFEMQKDYRYYLVLERSADTLRGLQLYSRFVSVIDYELDTLSQYVATYIPAADYVDSYVNEYGEIDCSAWGDFSGVVLYTMLSGHHVAAYSYDNGELTGQSFLYNPDQSPEENTTDFLSVMNGMELFVLPAEEETRSVADSALGPYWIEEITINGNGQQSYNYGFDNIAPWDLENFIAGPIVLANPQPITVIGQQTIIPQMPVTTARGIARKIFSNYSSRHDTTEICSMIEEIMNSKIGGNLLKALTDKNVKTIFDYDSDYKNSEILILKFGQPTITLNEYISHKLFHELFHALQASMVGFDTFVSTKANYEVECYVATFLYNNDSILDDDLSDYIDELSEAVIVLNSLPQNNNDQTTTILEGYYDDSYNYSFGKSLNHYYFNALTRNTETSRQSNFNRIYTIL